ncbi:MAG: hypothetical protein GY861_06745 [bacterium]|nr:hypothetical protein [bacterium]
MKRKNVGPITESQSKVINKIGLVLPTTKRGAQILLSYIFDDKDKTTERIVIGRTLSKKYLGKQVSFYKYPGNIKVYGTVKWLRPPSKEELCDVRKKNLDFKFKWMLQIKIEGGEHSLRPIYKTHLEV